MGRCDWLPGASASSFKDRCWGADRGSRWHARGCSRRRVLLLQKVGGAGNIWKAMI
jgi:hypothetical protein